MSIEKDIAIHGLKGISKVISYVTDQDNNGDKTNVDTYLKENFGIEDVDHMSAEEVALVKAATLDVDNLLSYAENVEKTAFSLDGETALLVTGVGCSVDAASISFQICRKRYYDIKGKAALREPMYIDKVTGEVKTKQAIECYHVIQSFPAIEGLDPRLVHRAGVEYAKRAFPGHKCVVTTHMNTEHLHNHIVVCAYHESEPRKFLMTMDKRREIRHINDQISLEFGLPILLDSNINHKSVVSYTEWEARNNGDLWKDRYRNDIRNIASVSRSWEEFVTIIRQSGYQVDDNRKYVTYRFLAADPDDTRDFRKIRDKTLGLEFTRDALTQEYGWKPGVKAPTHHLQRKFMEQKPSFAISRYSPTGRRRSDLEIIFLFAIKVLQFFKDWFFDRDGARRCPGNPIYKPYRMRMQMMQHAAFAVQELGLDNKDQLYERLNETGAKLSHVRKELENVEANLEFIQIISGKIRNAMAVKTETEGISFTMGDLMLHEPTEEQISAKRAQEMPMKPQMRQALYLKLEDNPQWKPKFNFSCLSHLQAQDVIAFLDGKTPEKPDCLISKEEFDRKRMAAKYESNAVKKDRNLKKKHSDTKITSAMRKKLEILKEQEGLDLDLDSLSMYDGMRVIGYFENRENHYGFNQSYISSEQRQRLDELLNRRGLSSARKTRYILQFEYDPLIRYLESGKGRLPDLLKPDEPIRESDRIQLAELLEIKGESCIMPLEELTRRDGEKLLTYLQTRDIVPEILRKGIEVDPDVQRDYDFANFLFERTPQERAVLEKYRNVLNDLVEHGIDPEKLDEVLGQEKALQVTLDMFRAQEKSLSKDYRNLKRLDTSLQLARTPEFTHGPLFTKEELVPAEKIEVREEMDKEPDVSEKMREGSLSPGKDLWSSLDDILSPM